MAEQAKKPKKKVNSKKKVLTPEEKALKEHKKVTIIGIGEVGIGAIYKLSHLNFTSYEMVKFETRDEFMAYNDDYSIYKNDIKKSRLIICLGDFNDRDTISAVHKIRVENKTGNNIIIAIGEKDAINNVSEEVDSIVFFNKKNSKALDNYDLSDTIGLCTRSIIAPTGEDSLININLSDLILLLKLNPKYEFYYNASDKANFNSLTKELTDIFNKDEKYNYIIETLFGDDDVKLEEVLNVSKKVEEKYKDATVLVECSLEKEKEVKNEVGILLGIRED